MFVMLITKPCSGLYENIHDSHKTLTSKNEWSLFFCYDLVIFSHFKVDPELRLGAEFPHAAVTAGNLTSVSKH